VDKSELAAMRRGLLRWMRSAGDAGLDPDSIRALFAEVFQEVQHPREETA
jgi:hypothetical protein